MKIIGIIIAIVLIVGTARVLDGGNPVDRAAEKISRGLPKMIDSETRLDRVISHEGTMNFKYTLVNAKSDTYDSKVLKDFLTSQWVENYCTNEQMASVKRQGIPISSLYYDSEGGFLTEIYIDPSKCNI